MNPETFSIQVRENLVLRFIRPEEVELLFELVNKNRTFLRQWLSWIDEYKKRQKRRDSGAPRLHL